MPKIPVYTRKEKLQPQLAEPLRREAAEEYGASREIISALQKTTEAWQTAHDTMQLTKAKSEFAIGLAEIDARSTDPRDKDFGNAEAYQQQREDLKGKVLQGIDNQEVAKSTAFQFDVDKQLSDLKTQSLYRQKEIEENKIHLSNKVDELQKKINFATNETEKQYLVDQRDELIVENINKGILTAEEAEKIRQQAEENAVQYDIYADTALAEKNSEVLAELRKKKGKYSYLDEKTRLKLIKQSQARIFQNNQTYKRAVDASQDERLQNIYGKINQGTLTLADLNAEAQIPESEGGLPPKVLKNLYDGYMSRTEDALQVVVDNDTKAADYLDYINRFINEPDKTQAREILSLAYKDHVLDDHEGVVLDKLKQETKRIESNKNMNLLKSYYRALKEYFTGVRSATNSEIALAIKELISKIGDQEDFKKAAEEIIYRDKINRNPAIGVLAAGVAGVPMMDANGIVKIVHSDGHTEEAK